MANSELNHQFLENIHEKVLECTICFKRLQNPKSLNCLHSFCLACLEDWVKEKGKLTCPSCFKSYSTPEGGLQNLSPNILIKNLLETTCIEQFWKTHQIECICATGKAEYYCQECRHYLCSTCSDHHKILPITANHKLHSVEKQSMTPLQIASPASICSFHNEAQKLFCSTCKVPICMHCSVTDHSPLDGNHKPISISKAFQTFKETAETLEKAASDYENKLQDGLKACIQSALTLDQNKDTNLRDIDNHVQEMCKIIKENGDKIKTEVKTIHEMKRKRLDTQIGDLERTISDIMTKQVFLNKLLMSDEVTAMQLSETVITALTDIITELLKTEPDDNGEIKFSINKQQMSLLQQCDIGSVTQLRAADYLTLRGGEYVTRGQTIVVKIIKTNECEIHAYQLRATWTQPTGETNITQVKKDDEGDYFVRFKCTFPGDCTLNVSAHGEPIRQSPLMIKVEKEGLVNTIKVKNEDIIDVVKCEGDCLLVSCRTNEIIKYKQSGEYVGRVTLPFGVKVFRMYKRTNGNIAFSDYMKCIKICNMNGLVIKSIGQGVLKNPSGIHVDEASNVVYVGDWNIGYVFTFNIGSGQTIRKLEIPNNESQMNEIIDVTLTIHQRHLLILEFNNSRLMLDNGQGFITVVGEGDENGKLNCPRGVVVDEDDNIIISSDNKLQVFSSGGKFIKRIDNQDDGINKPCGLFIVSYHPRRIAVANRGNTTIQIFNY